MVGRLLALLVVMIALLAGCADPGAGGAGSSGDAPGEIPSGEPPAASDSPASAGTTSSGAASVAAAHGQPTRTDSAITVKQENSEYVASKTVTIVNGFGGASQATVAEKTSVGGVAARSWSSAGYKAVILLESRGKTDSIARQGIGQMTVVHTDHLSGSSLALDTHVDFPALNCAAAGPCLSATVTDSLPSEPAYRFTLNTNTGGVAVAGLGGPSVDATTQTGGVDITGSFSRIAATAQTGGISLDGIGNAVDARTDTGGVKVHLGAEGSGTWTLVAQTGGIDATILRGSSHGVDADAQADTGHVDVSLSGGHDVGAQTDDHAHQQTDGFSQAKVQTTIRATTGTGGVDIQD